MLSSKIIFFRFLQRWIKKTLIINKTSFNQNLILLSCTVNILSTSTVLCFNTSISLSLSTVVFLPAFLTRKCCMNSRRLSLNMCSLGDLAIRWKTSRDACRSSFMMIASRIWRMKRTVVLLRSENSITCGVWKFFVSTYTVICKNDNRNPITVLSTKCYKSGKFPKAKS